MENKLFYERLEKLEETHRQLLEQPNRLDKSWDNGIYERYVNPVLSAAHTPLNWRYDLNPAGNPYLMERPGNQCSL